MEVVLRRAGDLAFLFQNYEFAYTNYYAAKKDLSKDQAPTFYAGVLVRNSFFLLFELIIILLFIQFRKCVVYQILCKNHQEVKFILHNIWMKLLILIH